MTSPQALRTVRELAPYVPAAACTIMWDISWLHPIPISQQDGINVELRQKHVAQFAEFLDK
jgi:hypothetical protein